jgi:hypothetical protein
MKKLILVAAAAASLAGFSGTAHAQSANAYIRYQEAVDPAYNRDRMWSWYGGYGSYDGYPIYYQPNVVKQNTARRGGQWYKACAGDPAVPINVDCRQTGPAPQPANQMVAARTTYIENGRLVEESNAAAQALPTQPAETGYWEEDQDQKCYVVVNGLGPNGERSVTRYCKKKG